MLFAAMCYYVLFLVLTASEGFLQHRSEDPAVRRRRWTESVHMLTDEKYTTATANTSNSSNSNSSDASQQPELVWAHGSIHTTKRYVIDSTAAMNLLSLLRTTQRVIAVQYPTYLLTCSCSRHKNY
jgi:hypothetical protein